MRSRSLGYSFGRHRGDCIEAPSYLVAPPWLRGYLKMVAGRPHHDAEISEAGCVDVTRSAVCYTTIRELHERVCAPFRLLAVEGLCLPSAGPWRGRVGEGIRLAVS